MAYDYEAARLAHKRHLDYMRHVKYYKTPKGKACQYRRNKKHRELYPEEERRNEKARRDRRNAESLLTATMNKERWCDVDDCFLTSAPGKLRDIAKALGRTYHAVQQRRQKLRREIGGVQVGETVVLVNLKGDSRFV